MGVDFRAPVAKLGQGEVIRCLDSCKGPKALLTTPEIMKSMDTFIKMETLTDIGTSIVFEVNTDAPVLPSKIPSSITSLVFLINSHAKEVRAVAALLAQSARIHGQRFQLYLLVSPYFTAVLERILEEEGVLHHVTVMSCNIGVYALDSDLLSLECHKSFRHFYLEQDTSDLKGVVNAFHNIQMKFGRINILKAKGHLADRVLQQIKRMESHTNQKAYDKPPEIKACLFIDRTEDLITPFVTILTYESLLDEIIGLQVGILQSEPRRRLTDSVYSEYRAQHFVYVFDSLSSKSQELQETAKKKPQNGTIAELKHFVLNDLNPFRELKKNVEVHVSLSQQISKHVFCPDFRDTIEFEHKILFKESDEACITHIERAIHRGEPLHSVLKLLCLYSGVRGIKAGLYERFRRELIQSYGYKVIFTLENFAKAGLITKTPATNFANLKGQHKLLVESSAPPEKQEDVAFVTWGAFADASYAPLSVRLVEASLPTAMKGAEGPERKGNDDGASHSSFDGEYIESFNSRDNESFTSEKSEAETTILIFFIGGCSYGEVNALRWLFKERYAAQGVSVAIATTNIHTSKSLIESLYDETMILEP